MKKGKYDNLKIGVTGRMGAGKSTLCRALIEHGKEKGIIVRWIEGDLVRRAFPSGTSQIPSMISSLKEQIASHTEGVLVVEWAMLAEHNLLSDVGFNVCNLVCDDKTIFNRLSGGDLPDAEIQKRLSLQMTDDVRRSYVENEISRAGSGRYLELDTTGPVSPGIIDGLIDSFREATSD